MSEIRPKKWLNNPVRLEELHLLLTDYSCFFLFWFLEPSCAKRNADYDEQVRRAAEREGRRTRRRCERERQDLIGSHLDGMSSDEETSDRYQEQFKNELGLLKFNCGIVEFYLILLCFVDQLTKESLEIMNDVNDEFCKIEIILTKFYAWRKTDMPSYKDAFVSLCLPKVS